MWEVTIVGSRALPGDHCPAWAAEAAGKNKTVFPGRCRGRSVALIADPGSAWA